MRINFLLFSMSFIFLTACSQNSSKSPLSYFESPNRKTLPPKPSAEAENIGNTLFNQSDLFKKPSSLSTSPNFDENFKNLKSGLGLSNHGNTCFLNATLQLLSQYPDLIDRLKIILDHSLTDYTPITQKLNESPARYQARLIAIGSLYELLVQLQKNRQDLNSTTLPQDNTKDNDPLLINFLQSIEAYSKTKISPQAMLNHSKKNTEMFKKIKGMYSSHEKDLNQIVKDSKYLSISEDDLQKSINKLTKDYKSILAFLTESKNKTHEARSFNDNGDIIGQHQIDAHEFLTFIIEELISTDAIFEKVYTRESFSFEPSENDPEAQDSRISPLPIGLSVLPLQINGESIQELISKYLEPENIDLRRKEIADPNPENDRATKHTFFQLDKNQAPPKSIIFQLSRFNNAGVKIISPVQINSKITIPFYNNKAALPIDFSKPDKEVDYYPSTIINHIGQDIKGGHYTAYTQDLQTGLWMNHNDSQVISFKDQESFKPHLIRVDARGNATGILADAYLVLYTTEPPAFDSADSTTTDSTTTDSTTTDSTTTDSTATDSTATDSTATDSTATDSTTTDSTTTDSTTTDSTANDSTTTSSSLLDTEVPHSSSDKVMSPEPLVSPDPLVKMPTSSLPNDVPLPNSTQDQSSKPSSHSTLSGIKKSKSLTDLSSLVETERKTSITNNSSN